MSLPGPAIEWEEGEEEDSGPINDEHNGGVPVMVTEDMEDA